MLCVYAVALRELEPEKRKVLAKKLKPVAYEAGSNIIKQGDHADCMFIVQTGTAAAEVHGIGVVMRYEAADYFGELGLLSDAPRAATVRATGNTTCFRIERDDFVLLRKYVIDAKDALYSGASPRDYSLLDIELDDEHLTTSNMPEAGLSVAPGAKQIDAETEPTKELATSANAPAGTQRKWPDGARYCRKCKVVFVGDSCSADHANFMYSKKIPPQAKFAE